MKPTAIIKICVDAVMYLLFLLLMGQYLLRDASHEWLGLAAGGLFILHNILNYKWYKVLFKGKYNAMRIVQTAVNLFLLVDVLCCLISGIFASQYIFSVGNGSTIELGRFLHLITTAWAFILMSVHLGLHWTKLTGMARKIHMSQTTTVVLRYFFRVVIIALCIYGAYLFVERRFWEELFHLIDYQKEYDESKTFFVYFAESTLLSMLFVAATYYIKIFVLYRKQLRRKRGNRK